MDREPQKPTVVVLFGAMGDLSHRKLLPGLLHLYQADLLNDARIVGTSLEEVDTEEFRRVAKQACDEHCKDAYSDQLWAEFAEMLTYVPQSAGT